MVGGGPRRVALPQLQRRRKRTLTCLARMTRYECCLWCGGSADWGLSCTQEAAAEAEKLKQERLAQYEEKKKKSKQTRSGPQGVCEFSVPQSQELWPSHPSSWTSSRGMMRRM